MLAQVLCVNLNGILQSVKKIMTLTNLSACEIEGKIVACDHGSLLSNIAQHMFESKV